MEGPIPPRSLTRTIKEEDDFGEVLMRTHQTIMDSTGHPRNSFLSSAGLLPHSTRHRHLVHQRAQHQELDELRLGI